MTKYSKLNVVAVFLSALALAGCGGSKGGSTTDAGTTTGGTTTDGTTTDGGTTDGGTTGGTAEKKSPVLFDQVVTSTFPDDMKAAKDAGFTHYSELSINQESNLKIRIIGTDDSANNEKIIRAGNILYHLLQNEEGSIYGADKSSIAKTMATREATLILTKDNDENEAMNMSLYVAVAIELNLLNDIVTSSGVVDYSPFIDNNLVDFLSNFANLSEQDQEQLVEGMVETLNDKTPKWLKNSQSLQYRELTSEGDCHYMSNFAAYCANLGEDSDRDAAFEEILHLVQAQGIAPNADTKEFQELVRARAELIYQQKQAGNSVPWNPTDSDWADWAGDDSNVDEVGPSYSHEYLAAVFESYMGMWRHKSVGLDGYKAVKRKDLLLLDAEGLALVWNFNEDLQYTARIQSEGVKKYYQESGFLSAPTFKMSISTSPPVEAYTFKSRHLVNAKIIGNAEINLFGNEKDNVLEGNGAANIIRAGEGNDTYKVANNYSECRILNSGNYIEIECPNTAIDQLYDVESIEFLDVTKAIDSF